MHKNTLAQLVIQYFVLLFIRMWTYLYGRTYINIKYPTTYEVSALLKKEPFWIFFILLLKLKANYYCYRRWRICMCRLRSPTCPLYLGEICREPGENSSWNQGGDAARCGVASC